jgi:hypothetical protein
MLRSVTREENNEFLKRMTANFLKRILLLFMIRNRNIKKLRLHVLSLLSKEGCRWLSQLWRVTELGRISRTPVVIILVG